mgnify:CR=1 FL=1
MKYIKLGLAFVFLSVIASTASADDCLWSTTGLSITAAQTTVTFTCSIGGSSVFQKTVTAKAVGSSTCSSSILSTAYRNDGSCSSPSIVPNIGPISGQKICEYNDPSTGTTPGCTKSSIAGGPGFVVYDTSKNGAHLMYVEVNTSSCSVKGTSSIYRVSGNCNNFRIYKI